MTGVLDGLTVLDFSSLLPGPLATLVLADAGADVIKVERPIIGEAGRVDDAIFAILNRGKRSLAIDLKRDADRLRPLLEMADIVLEQFRPGVMDRLGLGYDAVKSINPRVIYVSLNGYGSSGPDCLKPGHDLTYSAECGLLSLNADVAGDPVLPAALAADIGGGSLVALANIALALYRRERSGEGAHLDISMFAGTLPMIAEPLAHYFTGQEPKPGYSPSTGSRARYNIYRTADGRHLACAPAEDKFWEKFCTIAGLPQTADRAMVSARIGERTAQAWLDDFAGHDVCCSLVMSIAEAAESEAVRRLLNRRVTYGKIDMPALPSILDTALRADAVNDQAPDLGEMNGELPATAPDP